MGPRTAPCRSFPQEQSSKATPAAMVNIFFISPGITDSIPQDTKKFLDIGFFRFRSDAEGVQLAQESVFEGPVGDAAGHIQHQMVPVARAGGGAGIAALAAQDEVHVAHVRAQRLRDLDPAQVGQGMRAMG